MSPDKEKQEVTNGESKGDAIKSASTTNGNGHPATLPPSSSASKTNGNGSVIKLDKSSSTSASTITTTVTNGSNGSSSNQLLPVSQKEQLRKRSSTTVPPMVHRTSTTIINNPNERIVYRLVLTGGKLCFFVLEVILLIFLCPLGPCSGKTTGQARLSTFFENLGWKVSLIFCHSSFNFSSFSANFVNRVDSH